LKQRCPHGIIPVKPVTATSLSTKDSTSPAVQKIDVVKWQETFGHTLPGQLARSIIANMNCARVSSFEPAGGAGKHVHTATPDDHVVEVKPKMSRKEKRWQGSVLNWKDTAIPMLLSFSSAITAVGAWHPTISLPVSLPSVSHFTMLKNFLTVLELIGRNWNL
jgi:hypothetical protein